MDFYELFLKKATGRLFPENADETRLGNILPLLEDEGITYKELEEDVKRSLNKITLIEGMVRTLFRNQSSEFYEETDALATLLRISWELSQRRGRGNEKQTIAFQNAALHFLDNYGASSSECKVWKNCLTILSTDMFQWTAESVEFIAKNNPIPFFVQIINNHRMLIPWAYYVPWVIGLQWLSNDIAQMLYESSRLHHVGPIRDAVYSENTVTDYVLERLSMVLPIFDHYAEWTNSCLKSKMFPIPFPIKYVAKRVYRDAIVVFETLETQEYVE